MNNLRKQLAQELIDEFLESDDFPTIASINDGSCNDFANALNDSFSRAGFTEYEHYCTYDFISRSADSGDCEFLKDWKEESMIQFGVPKGYFNTYKTAVEAVDPRGVVGYHVWLYDGERHYDAECLDGVTNPLELPFFQLFTKE